jgi:hypothetical protein
MTSMFLLRSLRAAGQGGEVYCCLPSLFVSSPPSLPQPLCFFVESQKQLSVSAFHFFTTFSDRCLGSNDDEGRSEL